MRRVAPCRRHCFGRTLGWSAIGLILGLWPVRAQDGPTPISRAEAVDAFVEPPVVLLAAPLSFAGAMLLLLVTGTPLNVSSFMGLILLVGLIVKNGIILLDFNGHLRWR
jgi:AcrB/AcrD/AcrF family protein